MQDTALAIQADAPQAGRRERLLRTVAVATALIFFQAYMVAPLLPRLSAVFKVPISTVSLAVPTYLFAYGVATLFYGLLSDRFGRRPIMLASMAAFCVLTALTALVRTPEELIWLRLLTGLGASGVVPLALAAIGDLFPFAQRGRPLGWLFGAMAGGMAFGAVAGVLLEPLLGWRGLFLVVAALGVAVLLVLLRQSPLLAREGRAAPPSLQAVLGVYRHLLSSARGRRTYAYVYLNAVLHSGVFTWLAVHLARHYGLGETGIGLALLGYGIPGFLFGPMIGRLADRWGRNRLIPAGLLLSALCTLALAAAPPLAFMPVLVTLLSLGYDLTQPLLGGIVTDLSPQRGQAMGLNVLVLFVGFGSGSLILSSMLPLGLAFAFRVFGIGALGAAAAALVLFRAETHRPPRP